MASTIAITSNGNNAPTSTSSSNVAKSNSTNKLYSSYSSNPSQRLVNCSKFVPQAFNANKCQQCFNIKEIHSIEALADSKVSRSLKTCNAFQISPFSSWFLSSFCFSMFLYNHVFVCKLGIEKKQQKNRNQDI